MREKKNVLYFFAYKAQHFFNESLLDSSKSERIVLHSKQITWHRSLWTECSYLVTRRIFEQCLMAVCLQWFRFHTAILRLFQTFIFRRNLLIELWELFYHSYFDKQGLKLPDFAVKSNKKFRLMYYAIDFILILSMHAPMSICRNQDNWLVYGLSTLCKIYSYFKKPLSEEK